MNNRLNVVAALTATFAMWVLWNSIEPGLSWTSMSIGLAGYGIGAMLTGFLWLRDRHRLMREIEVADSDHFQLAASISEWDDEHTIPLTRELIKRILQNAESYTWTLQGFGMLRLYLGRYGRIHIWDSRYKFHNASEIHDHFWPLKSRIISGALVNRRYSIVESSPTPTHMCHHIVTGEGGYPATEPIQVELIEESAHLYEAGEFYEQSPTDVHKSDPEDGTVTLMARPQGLPGVAERARVFWPIGSTWGTAEPRQATDDEVRDITQNALRRWK